MLFDSLKYAEDRHTFTNKQLLVLMAIGTKPVNFSDLAVYVGCTKSALSRSLDALEERGLAYRWQDESDLRHVSVGVSEAGKELLRGVYAQALKKTPVLVALREAAEAPV